MDESEFEDSVYESVRVAGDSYGRRLFDAEETPFEYDPRRIPMLRLKDGGIWSLQMDDAVRIVILGFTGSGKTFLLRGLMDRLWQSGHYQAMIPDVKDEFRHSLKPVQGKFRSGLLPDEKPSPTPVVALRPTFFRQHESTASLPDKNMWYSFSPASMEEADFTTLLGAEQLSATQKADLMDVYDQIRNRTGGADVAFDPAMFERILEENELLDKNSIRAWKRRLGPLKSIPYYDPEWEYDVTELMLDERRFVPALNMEGFDLYGDTAYKFPEVTVGVLHRQIITQARRGAFKGGVFCHIDEAESFLSTAVDPSCKKDFIESARLNRRYGVSYSYVIQNLNRFPTVILDQCRYLFVPYSAPVEAFERAMLAAGMFRNHVTAKGDAARLKRTLGKWEWAVFDRMAQSYWTGKALSPLSFHKEA
jgi:hypothetical protein